MYQANVMAVFTQYDGTNVVQCNNDVTITNFVNPTYIGAPNPRFAERWAMF